MLYIVVISYEGKSDPMNYDSALKLLKQKQSEGKMGHIEHYNH